LHGAETPNSIDDAREENAPPVLTTAVLWEEKEDRIWCEAETSNSGTAAPGRRERRRSCQRPFSGRRKKTVCW
jgi:hypothetical protein